MSKNSICSQKQLNNIAHEHTIIRSQLFAGHVLGSWPMERKKHFPRMIMYVIILCITMNFNFENIRNGWKRSNIKALVNKNYILILLAVFMLETLKSFRRI